MMVRSNVLSCALFRCFGLFLAITTLALDADAQNTLPPIIQAMRAELQRSMNELRSQPTPPYFISYAITETHYIALTASFGNIVLEDSNRTRVLDAEVRVGSYELDNKRQIRGTAFEVGGFSRGTPIPLDDDAAAIRAVLWSATDRQYKAAVERYLKVISNRAVKVKEEDSSGDFSREDTALFIEPLHKLSLNLDVWRGRLRRLSALFAVDPQIYTGEVYLRAEVVHRYFVNSEGTILQTSSPSIRLFVQGRTKADDGMALPLFRSYFAFTSDNLPGEETLRHDILTMIKLLASLRAAPVMETYSGPAILSGEAAGVFLHEIFGHRIEGHRQKDVNSSQTFKNLIGERILPDFIDIVFDPSARSLSGHSLAGYFMFDDEGIRGQKVVAVKNGIFREFLMSRSPLDSMPRSNGHGRRQAGFPVVARQSNLIVYAARTVPLDTLRAMLRAECKRQGKEYGLYFAEIQGGFTFTNRTIPNAFNVLPLLVYKIYADGRPDEIVRGVDLIGTPLTTFKFISAAGNDIGVFNGVCGAESGGVPVSASSPSLLVTMIEVQKKAKSQAKPPILSSPLLTNESNE
ncbi:MAG: TldD/PmbA family protein [Bacteroidota bacterium]|nr:TldD/PmbA family protein [Candidatus Kapabacteria bacterium]MDW8220128.1 TldD/PmbA family protein [Bacteroidota bacterium]